MNYKKFADAKRVKGPKIVVNSCMMLNAKNLKFKHGIKKLPPKFYSPFQVIKEVNTVAFKLKLLATYKVYSVFHCSHLCPFNGEVSFNLTYPLVKPGHKYEVKQILKVALSKEKLNTWLNGRIMYLKKLLGS